MLKKIPQFPLQRIVGMLCLGDIVPMVRIRKSLWLANNQRFVCLYLNYWVYCDGCRHQRGELWHFNDILQNTYLFCCCKGTTFSAKSFFFFTKTFFFHFLLDFSSKFFRMQRYEGYTTQPLATTIPTNLKTIHIYPSKRPLS